MRRCRTCGFEKDDDAFYASRHPRAPRRTTCKKCDNAEALARQKANRERTRSANQRYYRNHADRVCAKQKDPAKERARGMVRAAVRACRLFKPDHCARCGRATPKRRLHAHHADYEAPMEITWLCTLCHGAEHSKSDREVAPSTTTTAGDRRERSEMVGRLH